MALGSSRPYLIRALYQWILDGDDDPYVVVDYFYPGVEVPESHGKDGPIVLNLAPRSLTAWSMSQMGLMFKTRFGGIPTEIILPYGAITAIYAKESGLGMAFGQEPGGPPESSVSSPEILARLDDKPSRERPTLRIVKSDD